MKYFKTIIQSHWPYSVLSIITLICYCSVMISPSSFWPAALLGHFIPVCLGFNAIAIIVLLLVRKKIVLIPILTLALGWTFIQSTFSYSTKSNISNNSIRMLSYNTKLFRKPYVYHKFSIEMIHWVANDTSDIKCIQEYSTNANWPALDVTKQIKEKGYNGYIYKANVLDGDHNPGMAIFSKYAILDSGIVFHEFNSLNAIIYADVQIENRIVRVYNVHLASMNLELRKSKNVKNGTNVLKKLKTGSVKRVDQINALINHAQTSPYPFIICGDFNETPYSYTYRQLTNFANNSFEHAGSGLGFTLNELPYFIRIDHQFYHSDIKVEKFEVFRKMKISDHFPTYGYYNFKE